MLELTREQVLAYRVAAQGLAGDGGEAVLDAGVQEAGNGSAAIALSARGLPADGLAAAWTFRGAPHLHRPRDLRRLATGLWPLGEDDAIARLGGLGPALKKGGHSGLDAYRVTAEAIRSALGRGASKSDLSTAVTKAVPEHLTQWCRGCGVTHVNEQLFRVAALPAGARIVPGTSPPEFEPVPRWAGVPEKPAGTAALVTAYLRVLGPAGPAEAAGYLGTTRRLVEPAWPDDLVEVRVEGRPAWIPEDAVAALRGAKRAEVVRLLPPFDPWLQARDRELIVPGEKHRKELWKILGNPGAVLVDGEVAGTWRAKATKTRLDVTVTPFGKKLPDLAEEAERLAAVRGAGEARVAIDD